MRRARHRGGNGKRYTFTGLLPGHYQLVFATPAGYEFTTQGGGGASDSDADPYTGETAVFTLAAGQTDTTRDAGFVTLPLPATVRGKAWADGDSDGIRDTGESGLAGVLVDLMDASGNVLATVETDAAGDYEFAGLSAGSYRVRFRPDTGTFSAKDQGTDDTVDSDAASDGRTDVFVLAAGDLKAFLDAGLHS